MEDRLFSEEKTSSDDERFLFNMYHLWLSAVWIQIN